MTAIGRPADIYVRLVGLFSAEFKLAKRDQARSWWCAALIFATGIVAVFVLNEAVVFVMAATALAAEAARWYFLRRSRGRHVAAERGYRAAMLMNGLGWQISGAEQADLLSRFSASEEMGRANEDPAFYDSAEPPSPRRLACLMEENAFWSKHLYRTSAAVFWRVVVAAVVIAFALLTGMILIAGRHNAVPAAQAVILAINVLMLADVLGSALDYSEAAQEMAGLDERLSALVEGAGADLPLGPVMFLFGDHNAIAERTPLIPERIYRRRHDRIAALWRTRRGQA